jgi:F0F1-type ATP synthase assembly protein I
MFKAVDRGTQVVSACLVMVVPTFLGLWVDQKLGTVVVFTILGLILGMWAGIWSLLKLLKAAEKDEGSGHGTSSKS